MADRQLYLLLFILVCIYFVHCVLLSRLVHGFDIQTLPLKDGLILESLRAIVRDIPNVLASSRICRQKNAKAQESRLVNGGCHNVMLEDIMDDYANAFES